jgi:hypothetical protein
MQSKFVGSRLVGVDDDDEIHESAKIVPQQPTTLRMIGTSSNRNSTEQSGINYKKHLHTHASGDQPQQKRMHQEKPFETTEALCVDTDSRSVPSIGQNDSTPYGKFDQLEQSVRKKYANDRAENLTVVNTFLARTTSGACQLAQHRE